MSPFRSGDRRHTPPWEIRPLIGRKYELTLVERRLVGERAVRVTLGGFDLERFCYQGGDQRCTLLIPWPEKEAWRYMVPMIADPWSAASQWGFAAALTRPLRRRLTVRGYRADALEIDFDIMLHDESPLSTWAEDAPLGSTVGVIDNGRRYHVPVGTRWQLLIADEAGSPAALAVAAETPAEVPTTLYLPRTVAATGANGCADHVTVVTVPTQREQSASGEVFASVLLADRLPLVPDLVGIAGERSFTHTLVTRLRWAGVSRSAIHAGSYWKRH